MREAVHIFLKDSRQLRYPILILLLWMIVFVLATAPPFSPPVWGRPPDTFAFVVPQLARYAFPIFWWFLISQAFHAEALPGDRQFWLTRPYSRASLFGAKALFVLAYVTLPLAVAQIVMATSHGLPLAASFLMIAWAQALVLMVVVLPAAALAALTSRLTQFIVGALLAPLLVLAYGELSPWYGLAWIRSAVAVSAVVAIAASVLFVQLTRRRTAVSRMIALGGCLALVAALPFVPWRPAFALQSRLAPGWDGTLGAELVTPGPRMRELGPRLPNGTRPIRLTYRVLGLPPKTPMQCEAAEFTLEGPDDRNWRRDVARVPSGRGIDVPEGCWFQLSVPNTFLDALADRRVRVRAQLYLTLFGQERRTTVPVDQSTTVVPGLGVCRAALAYRPGSGPDGRPEEYSWMSCSAGFGSTRSLLAEGFQAFPTYTTQQRPSYSPFPADLEFQPIQYIRNLQRPDATTITTRGPIAHIRIAVETPDLRLADFDIGN